MLAIRQGLVRYLLSWFQVSRQQFASLVQLFTGTTNTITASTFASPLGTATSGMPVLAPNGNIYLPPCVSPGNIGVINTKTNTTASITNPLGYTGQFGPGVLHPNGNIYWFPTNSSQGPITFNPTLNTVSTYNFANALSNASISVQWNSAVVGPDNQIYAMGQIPNNGTSNTRVAIIDPVANTYTFSNLGNTLANNIAWQQTYSAVRSIKNNKLYFLGTNSGAIACIDTVSQRANFSWLSAGANGASTFQDVASLMNAPNGNLVVSPAAGSNKWFLIDPVANICNANVATANTIQATSIGPDGNIYGMNLSVASGPIWQLNTSNNTATSNSYGVTTGSTNNRYSVAAPNGNIYFTPVAGGGNITTIKVPGTGNTYALFNPLLQSPYFSGKGH